MQFIHADNNNRSKAAKITRQY